MGAKGPERQMSPISVLPPAGPRPLGTSQSGRTSWGVRPFEGRAGLCGPLPNPSWVLSAGEAAEVLGMQGRLGVPSWGPPSFSLNLLLISSSPRVWQQKNFLACMSPQMKV